MHRRGFKKLLRLGISAAFVGSAPFVCLSNGSADDAAASPEPAVVKVEDDAPSGRSGRGKSPMPAFTPEREAAAVTFVSAHHPELAPLLKALKISRPNEYQKAIRKLFSDSERLAHSREMQPRRYELELQDWKLESRAQLLVARISMNRTPALEKELRGVLSDQMQVQRELLNIERERISQRVAVLDKEIARLDAGREKTLDERMQKALKAAGQGRSNDAGKAAAKSDKNSQ